MYTVHVITEKREAFGTLKDGKNNFKTNLKMRLLIPCKPWLGRVSKQLVEVQKKTKLLQFKNSFSVIQWFDKYSIDWKVIDKQKSFSSISNKCRLCLAESYWILYGDSASTNSKDEIWGFCRHVRRHILSAAPARVRMTAL